MDVKKICLVIPSLQSGGMERVMSELAFYFCSKPEYEVHLVLYGLTREIFYPIPQNIIVHKPGFVFDEKNNPLIVEISYGYADEAYDNCPGYWDEDLYWHEGKTIKEEWMVDLLVKDCKSI